MRRSRSCAAAVVVLALLACVGAFLGTSPTASATTVAWRDHQLNWDPTSWLAEGDVINRRPVYDFAALPIGNGMVTAMVWNYEPLPNPTVDTANLSAASSDSDAAIFNRRGPALGVALQVTRTDARDETPTLMRSAGRIFLPDLGPLMDARDTITKLAPQYGWVTTQSAGIYADARVQWNEDAIVMRLRDLPAYSRQRIVLDLPMSDRSPATLTNGRDSVALYETFTSSASSTGTTGSALVVRSSNTTAISAPDSRHATLTATADASGDLDITIAVPRLTSSRDDPFTAAAPIFTAVGTDDVASASTHMTWWGYFWSRSHLRVHQETTSAPAVSATSASSTASGSSAANAVDGNPDTKWVATGAGPQWLEVDFASSATIAGVGVAANPIESGSNAPDVYLLDDVQIQVPDGRGGWRTVHTVTDNAHWDLRADFTPVTTDKVRILVDAALNPTTPQIVDLELYGTSGALAVRRTTAQDSARYAQGLWIFTQYLAAVAQDGARWPLNGLQGPFTNRGDDSIWGTWMWHYNTRWATTPLYAADHIAQAQPYEDFYLRNLATYKAHTSYFYGTGGACVAEVQDTIGISQGSCGPPAPSGVAPLATTMILSSGTEVALNLWQHYRATQDAAFLDLNGTGGAYEFMKQVAIFYRDYAQLGRDGAYHVFPADAQEAYREVCDTIPDLAAIHTLFPIVSRLARARTTPDTRLADSLDAVIAAMPAWPTSSAHGTVLTPSKLSDCSAGMPRAYSPGQNPELDLVYPFGLAGTGGAYSTLNDAARRTFRYRTYPIFYDYAPEPVWAARLGLREDVRRTLEWGSAQVQTHPSGFSNTFGQWETSAIYTEWSGVVGTALNEMALQAPGDAIRVGEGWPADWGGSFQLLAPNAMLVSGELERGRPLYVGVRSRRGLALKIASPWGAARWQIVEETSRGDVTVWSGTDAVKEVSTTTGGVYRAEPVAAPVSGYTYAQVTGTAQTSPRTWCPVRHGLEAGFTLGAARDFPLAPACPQ